MVKKVVSSDMVAHLWAHQSQDEARNGTGSFSFVGPVLYSYRTPIAMLHDTKRGRVALITSDGYSVTTRTRHLNPARRALRGNVVEPFTVPYVGAYGGYAPHISLREATPDESYAQRDARNCAAEHAANVAHLADEYRELAGRILRAVWTHHTSQESVQHSLEGAAKIVTDYCDFFKIKKAARPVLDPADDARVIWGKRAAREARRNTPAAIAKRERAKELREALERATRERIARERFERDTKAREAFRAGARGYSYVYDERGGALLRVDPDGMVRTSLGAECPHEDARRAFALISKCRERAACVLPENRADSVAWLAPRDGLGGIKLGSFALSEIRADGSIRAGCHTIHWPEIEAAARALGLLS